MDLEFPRGDNQNLVIDLVDKQGRQIILGDDEMLYMTVKKNSRDKDYKFQKRLGNGIEKRADGKYVISIFPEDTNDLDYGSYGYDIELKSGNVVKTLGIYTITLTEEYTHAGNEV